MLTPPPRERLQAAWHGLSVRKASVEWSFFDPLSGGKLDGYRFDGWSDSASSRLPNQFLTSRPEAEAEGWKRSGASARAHWTRGRGHNGRMIRTASFLIALLLIAANLRPSLTSVGPLLKTIQDQLSLSATAAGLLTSLPLLAFAGCAPLARLARQHGPERMLLAAMITLIAGVLLRSEGSTPALFAGTALLATGIAVVNVLLPILIKQHYPDRVPTITTAYATTMGAVAALGSGVAVPLARVLPGGWQTSLASWALPAVIAAVFWLPHLRGPASAAAAASESTSPHPPWRTRLAWQVTSFMGLQSTLFYIAISWYPAILRDNGFSPTQAGWLLTLFQVAALLAGVPIPMPIRRFIGQRGLPVGAPLLLARGTLS